MLSTFGQTFSEKVECEGISESSVQLFIGHQFSQLHTSEFPLDDIVFISKASKPWIQGNSTTPRWQLGEKKAGEHRSGHTRGKLKEDRYSAESKTKFCRDSREQR